MIDPIMITVRAVQGGWTVESVLLGSPLMFLSGGRAERQAQRLAEAAIRIGRDVQVAVHDKLDALVALIDLPAAERAGTQPAEPDASPSRLSARSGWEPRRWAPRAIAPFASTSWRELVPA